MVPRSYKLAAQTALMIVAATALSACVSNRESAQGSESHGSSADTSAVAVTVDSAAAALLPATTKARGALQVGVDATYAPNEYKDENDKIVGFDVDLFDAVAATLGLTPNYVSSNFDNIIPGIVGGRYDVGLSSFTDNRAREKTVDFVTYYSAGIQFIATRQDFDPNNACGKKVSVQVATIELDDLKTRSAACTKAGKPAINIEQFTAQGDATTAVRLGKVDAMSADYPVSAAAVDQSQGTLHLVGETNFAAAPYGYAIAKTSGLAKALQAAVQRVIDTGAYDEICRKWGLTGGEIKTSLINAAAS